MVLLHNRSIGNVSAGSNDQSRIRPVIHLPQAAPDAKPETSPISQGGAVVFVLHLRVGGNCSDGLLPVRGVGYAGRIRNLLAGPVRCRCAP